MRVQPFGFNQRRGTCVPSFYLMDEGNLLRWKRRIAGAVGEAQSGGGDTVVECVIQAQHDFTVDQLHRPQLEALGGQKVLQAGHFKPAGGAAEVVGADQDQGFLAKASLKVLGDLLAHVLVAVSVLFIT